MSDNMETESIHSEDSVEVGHMSDGPGTPSSSSEHSLGSGTGNQEEANQEEATKVFLDDHHFHFSLHNSLPKEFGVRCRIFSKAQNKAMKHIMDEVNLEHFELIGSGTLSSSNCLILVPGDTMSIVDEALSVTIALKPIDEEPFVCRLDLKFYSPDYNTEFILKDKHGEIVNRTMRADRHYRKSYKLKMSTELTLHAI